NELSGSYMVSVWLVPLSAVGRVWYRLFLHSKPSAIRPPNCLSSLKKPMLRSIREPLNDIPSFVNDTPMIFPLRLSSLKFTSMPCLANLSHNSDQLLQ